MLINHTPLDSYLVCQEHTWRVFENRMLRKGGAKTQNWRDLHKEYTVAYTYHQLLFRYIHENDIGRKCGMHGEENKCTWGYGGEASGKDTTWKTSR
jgi:hypothetical protein